MALRVHSHQVLNNLIDFKHKVLRKEQRIEEGSYEEETRIYPALIHSKTGDIRFIKQREKIQDVAFDIKEEEGWDIGDWRQIHVIVHNPDKGNKAFEILDQVNEKFDEGELEKIARRIMQETLEVLNKKAISYPGEGRVEDYVLNDVSEFELAASSEEFLKSPAFKGAITREQAEGLLTSKEVGTYLIRDLDTVAESTKCCFVKENGVNSEGFILTVKTDDDQYAEYFLLKNEKWMVYNDNPDYQKQTSQFASFEHLLFSIPKVKKAYRS